MKFTEPEIFSLNYFEGPLDLLWQLINRNEIDIYEISLHEVIRQYLDKSHEALNNGIDQGAEFIALASSLLWFKSKTLLPQHEQQENPIIDEELDPNFEVIHQLIDYCHFKQLGKELAEREHQQSAYYIRGIGQEIEAKKNLGIDHLSLEDLAALFQGILAKTAPRMGTIHEETWKVSDKIKQLKAHLHEEKSIPFERIFSFEKSREELIVTFLALLELMKTGEARVVNDHTRNAICILATY